MIALLKRQRPLSFGSLISIFILYIMIVVVLLFPQRNLQDLDIHHTQITTGALTAASNAIAAENQRPGTTRWELDPHVSQSFIQGYAGVTSAVPGDTVPLYISTLTPIRYSLSVYRIGWYQGLGGRLVYSDFWLQGQTQGYWTQKDGLAPCPSCTIDPQTHLIETHWKPSYLLPVGTTWVSGVYLIKLTSLSFIHPAETYILLVVREAHPASDIVASLPVNTYQAYNWWGGWSLYVHLGEKAAKDDDDAPAIHADKVSFDRPYATGAGTAQFLSTDIHSVRWLERSGYDVSYVTDVDLDEQPLLSEHHHIFISLGHDEYWSGAMRDGVEAARDAGVSLAFFGADDVYWQIRYEPDVEGQADHTIVCYKVSSISKNPLGALSLDPMYPAHPELVTAEWRDPIINRPENALLGQMYEGYFTGNYAPDWVVAPGPLDSLSAGAGLSPEEHIRGGILGYEFDGVYKNGQTPSDLHILAESPVMNAYHRTQIADTTYYQAASGALVFDAGSIWWGWGLDGTPIPGVSAPDQAQDGQVVANLTANMLNAMLLTPPVSASTAPLPNLFTSAH